MSDSITDFSDQEGYIWFDGKVVAWKEAKLHVLSHGLHYASSVFEGLRAYNGKIFKLREHMERLIKSAEILDFKIPYAVEKLEDAAVEMVAKNDIKDGYVRPVAWVGSEKMFIGSTGNKVHVSIATWPYKEHYVGEDGIRMCFGEKRRPAPDTAPTNSKAACLYGICTIEKNKSARKGYDDALLLDYRGYVAEATVANFFMVCGEELHTPTADCFLNGITRQTIIQIARDSEVKVIERHINPEELKDADSAFLTGTVAEITYIKSIEKYEFKVGEMQKMLKEKYNALVGKCK